MPDVTDTRARLDKLIDRESTRIATIFRAAVKNVKEDMDLDRIARLLERGQVSQALEEAKKITDSLAMASQRAFIGSAQDTAAWLESAGVGSILLDQVNEGAVAVMRENTLRIVTEFTDQQRRATQAALVEGITQGINPRDQARAFRDSIGLTQTQIEHVSSYRRALERVGQSGIPTGEQSAPLRRALRDARSDKVVSRAIKRMTPLSPDQIERMTERYRQRYIKHRSETIARTEAMSAVNQGNDEAFRQGAQQGVFELDELEREWDASGDSRVRDTHNLLDGQKRKFGESWTTVNGTLRYPGDPAAPAEERIHCRCVILTRVKKAALQRAA